jgi:putative transposase
MQKRNQDTQRIARTRDQRVYKQNFWTRGYYVSTVGLDEKQIREYIQNQEKLKAGEQEHLNF